MKSLKQFFSYMNDISFEYVVLRNWDSLPYDVCLGEHSDLDLLVYDFSHFLEVFPQAKAEHGYPRVRMRIPIDDSYIYLDVRHVGDDYYPEEFEKAILSTREFNPNGFFTPDPLHHRIALAYHAVHHKNDISKDYRRFLGDCTISQLLEALKQSNVGWVEPKDRSVGRFNGYFKGCTSIVEKQDGWYKKSQVSYLDYPLVKNEIDILKNLDSIHIPKIKDSDNSNHILIEDCGEQLCIENLPENWRDQLSRITNYLDVAGVLHRDIRLENLMVKDGIIKLIDFGWAKFRNSVEEKDPPSCLGFPNRPSSGFSDLYSMKRVIKQIEYMLEEKGVYV